MMCFLVIDPGFFTTVQDLGRYGYLKCGVPISGAMDNFALATANALVGNRADDACLEATIIGPKLKAVSDLQIAITGAECQPMNDDSPVPMWQTLTARKGELISLGKAVSGCRIYISVGGGIDVPEVLGSRSTYVRGGFGGFDGRKLKAGDKLKVFNRDPSEKVLTVPEDLVPKYGNLVEIYAVPGPQADAFTEEELSVFFSGEYCVSSDADRMGYRLDGPGIHHRVGADIVSDALLPGAVQVPKDGKPIVMMRDAQTTGGYTKIAVVGSADVDLLGQAKPGNRVRFIKVTVKEAQERLRKRLNLIKGVADFLISQQR